MSVGILEAKLGTLRFSLRALAEAATALDNAGYTVVSPRGYKPEAGELVHNIRASMHGCMHMNVGWYRDFSPEYGSYVIGFWREPELGPLSLKHVRTDDSDLAELVEAANMVFCDDVRENCTAIRRHVPMKGRFKPVMQGYTDDLMDWLEEQRERMHALRR